MSDYAYPRGTVESVTIDDVAGPTGTDLSGDTFEISIHRGTDYQWLPAQWIDDGVICTNDPVSFDQTAFPALGNYTVAYRLTRSPQVPIVIVGSLSIVS